MELSMISPQPTRPWGKSILKPQDFTHDWENYVTIKVKSVRAVALSGLHDFSQGAYTVAQATGFIELLGSRAGPLRTLLQIGFTNASKLPDPGFGLYESIAIGTLTLPASCFGSILQLVNSPTAHFRIGGDGRENAIATESPLLQMDAVEK